MRSKFKWIFTLLIAFTMQFSFAQEKTVTGVVSDANGPLPGANVVIKGTTKGASADVDGKYSIKAKVGDVLEFSFQGYDNKSATVGAANVYNAKLTETALKLDEVVVSGALGIKKRVDQQTSQSTVVKAAEITQAGSPTVVQGLIGKVSGLQINTTSNGVNSSQRIVINGPRSITGNNQALVVIDNVNSTAAVLNSLPPDSVESINVLKGAQGAALYGEQGVNGVIIVTTKRGSSKGKLTVEFNSNADFQKIAYLPERQTRYGQGWFGEQIAIENGGWGAELDGTIVPVGLPQADGSYIMAPYSPIKDNIGKFFKTGTIFQNDISISGGTLKDGYANFSVGRQDREFVVDGDQLKRTNVAFKAGRQFGKLFVEGNVQYYQQLQENTSAGLYAELLQTATNIPIELFENSGINHHWNVYYRSPYWTRDNVRGKFSTDYISAIATLKYDFNKHISASWDGNVQLSSGSSLTYTNAWNRVDDVYNAYSNRVVISNLFDSTSMARRIYSNFMLNFDYDLSKDFTFGANIGNNIQDGYSKVNQVGGSQLDIDGWYNFSNVLQPSLASGLSNNWSRSRRFSYFANVDLGYKEYLNLNITGRNDWSSTLSKENRSFFYPSVGLSFVPTKAFGMSKNKVFNYAKITLGWTRVGNSSAVAAYDIDQVGATPIGYPFGTLSSYVYDANPTYKDIKPEFVTTQDIGLNLGFFKDRLTIDAQYYIQNTKDLITNATASSTSGLNSVTNNIGELKTTGYNIDLGIVPIRGKGFQWDAKLNLSHYKTIVEKIADGIEEVNLNTNNIGTAGIFAVVGEEFPLIKGIGYLRDASGNVIVDSNTGNPLKTSEFIKLGKSTPDYILGFTNSVSYKGLKFTAVCDYRTGHQFYSEVMYQLAWSGHLIESAENGRSGGFIFPNSVVESSTNPGVFVPNTNVVTGGNSYADYQTYYSEEYATNAENLVLDASAFKVRELALSYSFPKTFIQKSGLSGLTLGVNARNPFMVLPKQNRNYADPETSNTTGNSQGIANIGQYPYTRTFGFSLNVKF